MHQTTQTVYISKPCCFAPGLGNLQDFIDWKNGSKSIELTNDSPALSFTTPLFKRRLSQLCKMTVQVVHDCLEQTQCGDIKQFFVSLRGEINREFTINEKLIQENDVSPSAFSYSVFNAPIALATLACNLHSGYTTIFPSQRNFLQAVRTCIAGITGGTEDKILFVYGDELVPEVYGSLRPEDNTPLAFAFVISRTQDEICSAALSTETLADSEHSSPADFLKKII